jgi:hypothetical protein
MLTDLVEGRLRDLAHDRVVLRFGKDARQLTVWMHVRDDHRARQGGADQVGQCQCIDGALRAVDADDDRAAIARVVAHRLTAPIVPLVAIGAARYSEILSR